MYELVEVHVNPVGILSQLDSLRFRVLKQSRDE
jgi:hypothetical protein